MSAATRVASAEEAGETPVRHALRRLSVYLRRNWRYYSLWYVVVLLYSAAFNALPLAVGWSVSGLIDPEVGHTEVVRRCAVIMGVAARRGRAPLLLATAGLQRRPGGRVRDPKRSLRSSPEAAAILLFPMAHRRSDEPLRRTT